MTLDELERRLITLRQTFPSLVRDSAMQAATEVFIPPIRDLLLDNDNVFRGDLLDSIAVSVSVDGTFVVGSVGSDLEYASFVESGSDPRPINDVEESKLLDWVEQKLRVRGEAVDLVLYRVINKIQTEGSDKHPFLSVVVPAYEGACQTRFSELVGRGIDRIFS
jgi:hypothetical protein